MRGDPVVRRRLAGWRLQQLPAIVELNDERAVVLLEMKAGDALIYSPGTSEKKL
jgi:ATP-binding cassette subfamily C protein LapB